MRALNRMNAIVRYGNFWRTPKLEGTGINPCDRPYLYYICRNPGVSQETLSAALLVNKSSVARRLAQLEKEGYVTRVPDENDRRVLLVSPTKKAQELLPVLQEMAREWNEIITEGFTAEEIEVFATLIERACANARRKAQELTQ